MSGTTTPIFLATPQSWTENAKCRGMPTEDFDVDNLKSRGLRRVHHAQRLCRGCTVIGRCAWDAYETHSEGYVRAGVAVKIGIHNVDGLAHLLRIAAQHGVPQAITEMTRKKTR